MAMFTGFKPQGLQKIASKMGYAGRMEEFDSYLQQNPDKQREMIVYQGKAQEMARGGVVRKLAIGGISNITNAQVGGEDAQIKTMAEGEDDGDMGGGFPPNFLPEKVTTFAVGEEDGSGGGELKTLAIGEDYPNRGTFEGRLPGPETDPFFNAITQAVGEDGGGGAIATTLAAGEEGGMPFLPVRPPGGITRAIGEDGSGGMPVARPIQYLPGMDGYVPPTQRTPDQAYVPTLGTGVGQVAAFGTEGDPKGITDASAALAQTGAIPVGAVTQPQATIQAQDQMIDPRTGQVSGTPYAPTIGAETSQADPAQEVAATQMTASQVTPAVETALQANQAAQTDVTDPNAKVMAAQQTASSVGNLTAAQGNATLMSNPVQREIQAGELIAGVANAQLASAYTEQIQAATATPSEKATVQGQLATLTENFDASNPPPWAAGTLRAVQAQMAQRGLGASSMAGQAMIQGALESALPIAQADAQVNAQFEGQNLSNRQARAMLAAQQRATFIGQEFDQAFQSRVQNSARIGDIANANFTAEQNIAMENSRAVNTMNLANLGNKQALVMGEASALANLDLSNLSNNQQAAVQNAQNFLQMEMANLSNSQQTALFNAQAINQSLLTDQAATNAASQFNATSDNQTKQFMSNLTNQVSQFNATQSNAQNQFNAGEANTLSRFNAEVANQRDQFNAQNQLAIAQNNAVWRREIATADTASINRANELNAKAVLDTSTQQYDNLWNYYADTMEWAWKSAESEQERIKDLVVANLDADAKAYQAKLSAASAGGAGIGKLIGTLGGAALEFGFSNLF
jgi:hypothetical protein